MNWFPYVAAATVAYGLVNFIYKISAHYGYSSLKLLNFQSFAVSLISGLIIFLKAPELRNLNYILILAAVNSFFFTAGTVLKITSLKHIPVNVAMPIGKFNTVFVILIGIIFFKDRPDFKQAAGMALALGTVFMLAFPEGNRLSVLEKKVHFKGVAMILTAAAAISISITAGKIASGLVDKISYIWLSYTLVFIYTRIAGHFIVKRKKGFKKNSLRLAWLGFGAGILNLGGYYLILKAWEYGPLSLVQGIFSLSTVITIMLAAVIYKEKFSPRKVLAVMAAIAAAVLIKG